MSAAPAPRRHAPRLRIAVLAIAAVVIVVIGGVTLFIAGTAHDFDANRRTLPEQSFFPVPNTRPEESSGDAQNILLLGSDTRGAAPTSLSGIRAQRSDTILLVHIPADRRHVYVMSIMRDSWVDIPGHGKGKINAALSFGGVPLTVQVIEQLVGLRIDHVAIVSFGGFAGMTDALGGVRVDNAVTFDNLGHHFPKGPIDLHGTAALAFVRARYPFADGDYQRVRNQRAYLNGVVASVLRAGRSDPFAARAAIRAVAPYLLTDPGLDSGYLGALALSLRDVRTSGFIGFTVPTTGTGTEGDQSVVYLDEDQVTVLRQDLQSDSMSRFEGCSVSIC